MISWTKAQVQARSHPNLLESTAWLNQLYHFKNEKTAVSEGVDLSVPLMYADRFRIRHPGNFWPFHPPHIDGKNAKCCDMSTIHSLALRRRDNRTLGGT